MDLFAKQAVAYVRFRPRYPRAIIEWILGNSIKQLAGSPDISRVALDLGTGSGQMAVPLAQSTIFSKVIGVDQSAPQIENAPKDVDRLEFRIGDATRPLDIIPAGSCALVTAAQCAHWFVTDTPTWQSFTTGVCTVLQPGGIAFILGYSCCHLKDPKLQNIFESFYASTEGLWHPDCRRDVLDSKFLGVDFSPLKETKRLEVVEERTILVEAFLAYVGTWSAFTHDRALFDKLVEDITFATATDSTVSPPEVTVVTPFFAIRLEPEVRSSDKSVTQPIANKSTPID